MLLALTVYALVAINKIAKMLAFLHVLFARQTGFRPEVQAAFAYGLRL